MSVKSFKFVSPGVFINEIDNSYIPRSAQEIGPVIVGRATRGLAMQPVTVQSYSDFVEMFGDTVPGNAGGDISRDGNFQSPMYGTYAAKAFLNANVAPVTYVRLLGVEGANSTTDGKAGWATSKNPGNYNTNVTASGGAYGLYLFKSSSQTDGAAGSGSVNLGTGYHAATFYIKDSVSIMLSGNLAMTGSGGSSGQGVGYAVYADESTNLLTAVVSGTSGENKIKFDFDDNSDTYIREVFNTNPQLCSTAGHFYPSSSHKNYWLGETYDQFIRQNIGTARTTGVILPLALSGSASKGPHNLKEPSREAGTGWFISQDTGAAASFEAKDMQKLFRFVGRGHGAWLSKNCKISIENIRTSFSSTSDYGTFSVVVRNLLDTDNKVQVMERFDNCTLDPSSPNFVARKIGDVYFEWNSSERRLRKYGEYPNQSKYIRIIMNTEVEDGATDPVLLPFGYFGPPKYSDVETVISGGATSGALIDRFVFFGSTADGPLNGTGSAVFFGGANAPLGGAPDGRVCSGSLSFATTLLRISASDGGLTDPTNAYWGFRTTRTAGSTRADNSVKDLGDILQADFAEDPSAASSKTSDTYKGIDMWSYVFSLNDISASSDGGHVYSEGSRKLGNAVSTADLISSGSNRFTAPLWGGFDGFDIYTPDPMYNSGMTTSATEANNYIYASWKQAMDTVADPEFINMNMLVSPGLTNEGLTQHMIDICEERADAMSIIDLPGVYKPTHEGYESSKKDRLGSGANAAAAALRQRGIDSSYGCTFYPWVQTSDANTSKLLWIPPSVAMMGVLASSQASTKLWFAPAGFNRGGLSDGAAGIPVLNVTERVVSKDRDTLYDARINPIASFPSTGIVVFGQKTLQERSSALDRINVRRLVIYLKKQISILASQVLFEQNVQATWNRFTALIDPFLQNVQTQFGITDYRLILDSSTTTPDLVDQNILYAKIMVKPARAIEFIAIDFVVTSTGASFDD